MVFEDLFVVCFFDLGWCGGFGDAEGFVWAVAVCGCEATGSGKEGLM